MYETVDLWFVQFQWWYGAPAVPQAMSIVLQFCGATQETAAQPYVWWEVALRVFNIYAGVAVLGVVIACALVYPVLWLRAFFPGSGHGNGETNAHEAPGVVQPEAMHQLRRKER